ncbi:MAG: NusG domain II-containing protein [Lachnospiraceae bacterium]|nr:NusG domain II-containing protein [Lachnospiraceae bacterium]
MSDATVRDQESSHKSLLHSLRRADIILIVGCLLAALVLTVFFALHRRTGSMVRISCDSVERFVIDLTNVGLSGQEMYYMICHTGKDEDNFSDSVEHTVYADQDVYIIYAEDYPTLPEGGSYNLISVADGKITMEAADCRDQICVHHKPIISERENIICLPHKLVVEIVDSGRKPGSERRKSMRSADADDELLDGVTR